jgi:mRNA interferase HigB
MKGGHNVLMMVQGEKKIKKFILAHREYKKPLTRWLMIAQQVDCKKYADIKATFSSADWITVNNREYLVFNIKGKKVRLIASVNFMIIPPALFIRKVLTHAEYSKERWKSRL